MSKQSCRYQRGSNDKETRLLKLWQAAAAPVDAFFAEEAQRALKSVRWFIAGKAAFAAESGGRLASCDERIYNYYKKLMWYYNTAVALYNEHLRSFGAADGKAGEILEGLCAVVMSRIIDPSAPVDCGEGAETSQNPVKIERKMLIAKCTKVFSEAFDQAAYRIIPELYGGLLFASRNAVICGDMSALYGGICDFVTKRCAEKFHRLYLDAVASMRRGLDDFFERQYASHYNELLHNELEILKGLATVTVPALEAECAHLSEPVRAEIYNMLTVIREAWQRLAGDAAELRAGLAAARTDDFYTEDLSEFTESLSQELAKIPENRAAAALETRAAYEKRMETFREHFERDLSERILLWYKSNDFSASLERRMISEAGLAERMSDGVIGVFGRLVAFCEDSPGICGDNTTDGDIVRGIVETLKIKIESLNEAFSAFQRDIYDLPETLPSPPDKDSAITRMIIDESFAGLKLALGGMRSDDRHGIPTVKKYLHFREDNPVFSEGTAKLRSPYAKAADTLQKKTMRYKKEHLLFEISTFEEILNYSVSRLRESRSEHTVELVRCIDQSVLELERILTENGIALIKPQAHDVFNGKEHEVLMAEKNDDFKKGEIIKLMNSGYRQGDTIILRANVIAAK